MLDVDPGSSPNTVPEEVDSQEHEPVVARIVCRGFQPAAWLLSLIEHRTLALHRDHAGMTGCRVQVTRTSSGWDVALQLEEVVGPATTLARTVGFRPKDVMVPVRDAFDRAQRQLGRRAALGVRSGAVAPMRFVVSIDGDRSNPLGSVRKRSALSEAEGHG
jgi:hypothetical protein